MMPLSSLHANLVVLIIASFFSLVATISDASEVSAGPVVRVGVQNFSDKGQEFLAVLFSHRPHWHTYWKNPGDAGTPLKVEFTSNGQMLNLTELEWPTPLRFLQPGPLLAYGYNQENALFFLLTPENIRNLEQTNLEIRASYLACADICVPEATAIRGSFLQGKFHSIEPADQQLNFPVHKLEEIYRTIPASGAWPPSLQLTVHPGPRPQSLFIRYVFTTERTPKKVDSLLFPFPLSPLTFGAEKLQPQDASGSFHGEMVAEWDGEFLSPPIPFPTDGKFNPPLALKFIFTDPFGRPSVILKPVTAFTPPPRPNASDDHLSWYLVIIFALLGGIILNFMPCVLPVISLKLFGLLKSSQSAPGKILLHNLVYTAGILVSFLVLATIVVALKLSGEEVGWGMQLQSPRFVAAMIIFLFLLALNMFGLYEIPVPGGRQIGNVKFSDSWANDFFSGILATLLSTPCSAPFLGAALAFAFTTSSAMIFLVFILIGVGLALPFLLVGFFPRSIRFLPRPGAWMETVKKFLALALVLTAVWLMDIFLALTDHSVAFFYLLLVLVFSFFVIYIWRQVGAWRWPLLVIPCYLGLQLLFTVRPAPSEQALQGGAEWQVWNEEQMSQIEDLALINFTAKWCLTCKVNEKLVFETPGFRELVQQHKMKLLKADWTRKDPAITNFLQRHNHAGVPAYFLWKDKQLHPLGETISVEKIAKILQAP